jgi:hypothetical protein
MTDRDYSTLRQEDAGSFYFFFQTKTKDNGCMPDPDPCGLPNIRLNQLFATSYATMVGT